MKLFKNRTFDCDGLIDVFLAITSFLIICAILAIGFIGFIAYIALLVYYPVTTLIITASIPVLLLFWILACAAFDMIFPKIIGNENDEN